MRFVMAALCRVSYRDVEGIEHAVEIEADTASSMRLQPRFRFRGNTWRGDPPGPASEFSVKVFRERPTTFKVPLSRVTAFALHGTAKGPKDIARKQRIRALLGL